MNGDQFLFFVALLSVIQGTQGVVGQGAETSFSIEQGEFVCGGNLLCLVNATTTGEGLLKLTPDPRPRIENYTFFQSTVGMALYNQPVQLVHPITNQVASFNIVFSLRIESGLNKPSDGMSFVMFGGKDCVGPPGGGFGAYTRNGIAGINTLAVEFDTYENPEFETDNNHVGIGTVSSKSVKAKKLPFSLDLERVYTWVDYNSLTSTLAIRVNNTTQKPVNPFISYTTDLRDVFDEHKVWVGFSGSNGACECFNYYTVFDLSFNSSFPPVPAAPSPAAPVLASRKPSVSTGLVAGVVVGLAGTLLLGCLLLGLLCVRRRRQTGPMSGDSEGGGDDTGAREFHMNGLSHNLKMYSYDELCAATEDFSNAFKLGEGGFGSVYRGCIRRANTELLVAVKKVKKESKQGEREFVAEVSTIGMLRHRNIVQLLGWCCDGPGNYLLVYEFMPNGSLDRHLHPRARTTPQPEGQESILSWERRFKVLGGLAAALQYLHEGWRQQVLHRDVKSSNVMLDDSFNAVLGDFGLARMADHYQNPETTEVAGTYGYIAPEVPMTRKFTAKADVYAFGAVCLEIVCGRKVYDVTCSCEDSVLLVEHVWRKLSDDKLVSLVDVKLEGNYELQQVELVLLLGLLCSHPKPDERPDMRKVVEILAGRVEMPPIANTKPLVKYFLSPDLEQKISSLPSGSGTDVNEIGNPHDSSGSISRSDSTGPNSSLPGTTSSHTSGLTSFGDTSSSGSIQPYGHGDPEVHS